jgi:hypothetical protein
MAAAAKNGKGPGTGSRAGAKREPSPPAAAKTAEAAAHVCDVAFCPIGLALTAVQPLRPDAVEHLLVAGRELFLAMRTIVDARAEQFAGESAAGTFEKIDIGHAGTGHEGARQGGAG